MATLISPGVSVTITNESFFIPAGATTVPLFFIATADEKSTPTGAAAPGTYEHGVVRTVTSLSQSVALYGTPRFLVDGAGSALHGDVRNEYGLFALNQFLGVGNRAYVVRANVNLNDDIGDIRDLWDVKVQESAYVLENLVNVLISDTNISNGLIPSDPGYKVTVTAAEVSTLIAQATEQLWETFSFRNSASTFLDDATSSPYNVYANGYASAPTGTFLGMAGMIADWVSNMSGTIVGDEWTAQEAANMLTAGGDLFKYTIPFMQQTTLGANDAARRVSVVTALQAAINSNTDVRSETYEYNLILCPGFPEVVDELLSLSTDINEEAFVIADTPMTMTSEEVVAWAATTSRQASTNVAYYYPHGLASNLDGNNVVCAASGIALRTFAYSDEVADLWWAPAGTQRGLVSGVADVGYVSGTPGTATTFVPVAVNQGQRDDLYKYFTNINPIVFFPGRGLVVFGQKTSAPDASALDRINVVRLMMYIKRQLRKNTLSFIFQPNDQLTRDSLKAVVDSFLGDLVAKRGLYDFASICDLSNNTPDRIDRNEMYIDIAVKPTKAAEFLYIPIRVVNTGTEI